MARITAENWTDLDAEALAVEEPSWRLDHALELASAGTPLFPCGTDKRPLCAHGFKDATTADWQIRAWWRQWPNANFASPTGAGLLVVDVDLDAKKGTDGFAAAAALNLPDTYTVATPRGGEHRYYRTSETTSIGTNSLGSGVDHRGDGGYVLLPGSRTDEGWYEVVRKLPQAPAPENVLASVRAGRERTTESRPPSAPSGDLMTDGRKDWIFKKASALRGLGLSESSIEAALLQEAPLVMAEPDLYGAEIRRVASNVEGRYNPNPPAGEIRHGATRRHALSGMDLADIAAMDVPPTPPTLPVLGVHGILPQNFLVLVAAYAKVGKTTLLTHLFREWSEFDPELTVLYLSEENIHTWAPRMKQEPAPPRGVVRVEFASQWTPRQMLEAAAGSSADVIVLDTARNLLGVKDENDNAEVARALAPWQGVKEQGKTVVILHHESKAGGTGGRGITGAQAWFSACDSSIELTRVPDAENQRRIKVTGRAMPPAEHTYQRRPDGSLVMFGEATARQDRAGSVLAVFADGGWHSKAELRSALPDVPETTFQRLLRGLVVSGQLEVDTTDPRRHQWRQNPEPTTTLPGFGSGGSQNPPPPMAGGDWFGSSPATDIDASSAPF